MSTEKLSDDLRQPLLENELINGTSDMEPTGLFADMDSERQRCEVWSRCMGYHRPVESWNIGKQQEFKDRVYFEEGALTEQDGKWRPRVSIDEEHQK